MQLRLLNTRAFSKIYKSHMVHDFPKSELKPLAVLLVCMHAGTCRCYGLYDDAGELASYAVMLFNKPGEACIMDYLSTVRHRRGQGFGQEMLRRMQAELHDCAGILIEYEFPEDAPDEAERNLRLRRERFYLHNGVRRTQLDLILFGVHFCVGYLPCAKDLADSELKRMQIAVYERVHCWDYHFHDGL